MRIVVDTHTLFWFIIGDKRLSAVAKNVLESTETLFIPTIVILELFSLMKKKGLLKTFHIALEAAKKDERFIFVSSDMEIVDFVISEELNLEMHDSIIVCTAMLFNAPILTRDRKIKDVYKNVIW